MAVTPDMTRLVTVGMDYVAIPPTTADTSRGASREPSPPLASNGNGAAVTVGRQSENRMIVYDLESKAIELLLPTDGELTSVKISDDSQFALINHAPDEVHLWDLHEGRLARKFTGQHQVEAKVGIGSRSVFPVFSSSSYSQTVMFISGTGIPVYYLKSSQVTGQEASIRLHGTHGTNECLHLVRMISQSGYGNHYPSMQLADCRHPVMQGDMERPVNPAWNGKTSPGSDKPKVFSPFYVPPGAKSYDSSSPLIRHDSLDRRTWRSDILLLCRNLASSDGREVEVVDAWSNIPRTQQRLFWKYDLPYGKHLMEIKHTGRGAEGVASPVMDVDALVVTNGRDFGDHGTVPTGHDEDAQANDGHPKWSLVQRGSTGVAAMQLAIISPSHALIVDKVEHNPISIDGHPGLGGTVSPQHPSRDASGDPVKLVLCRRFTSPADFGHLDGLQAVRLFHPCTSPDVSRCYMLSDGSAMIIGGSKKGGWMNNATVNNPTVEYWPPKSIHGSNGLPIHLSFLVDTLNANLFPIAFALPDGKVFMAANRDAMVYDWKENKEQRLPRIPNGVRVTYPMAGVGLLLPLSPEGYTPEILICGGSAIDDTTPGYEISSQDPASNQCSRIALTEAGIASGWEIERLPEPRHMPDAVLLPTGQIFIVNGAKSGISGYGNVKGQVGESNADNPNLTPILYTPDALPGQRFSNMGMKSSLIPRMYHSVATLTPDADILVAGSNPNLDRSEVKYGSEYRVERFRPPYMSTERPTIIQLPHNVPYGHSFEMGVNLPSGMSATEPTIKVALMDLGFVTHARWGEYDSLRSTGLAISTRPARDGSSLSSTVSQVKERLSWLGMDRILPWTMSPGRSESARHKQL
ncbi:glyoxal oxidase N-terminus-domain-containing protein [Chiua virens]|nr:glyoxal oxidase N-terminus-domain-containing protein [Chiua virens]